MFGNVTALVGLICIDEMQEQKHAAHLLQLCGLGSSQDYVIRSKVFQAHVGHCDHCVRQCDRRARARSLSTFLSYTHTLSLTPKRRPW